MYESIIDALRKGDHKQALSEARKAVGEDPDSAEAQRMLAMALNARGDREAAFKVIDHALGFAPDNSDLHLQRANMLFGAGQIDAAQSAASESIRSNPNQFAAYILQAQMAIGFGDADEAERLNTLATRVDPDHPWRHAIEGMVALARGDNDSAIATLSRAAEASPDDPQVLLALALSHAAAGHHAFAEQALRNLLQTNGEHAAWRMLLVQSVLRQRRTDDAMAELEPLLDESQPIDAAQLRLAGEIQLAAGHAQEALHWLRRALRKDPGDARALSLAMRTWEAAGDAPGAKAALEEALETSPQVNALWEARAAVEDDVHGAAEVVRRWNEAVPGQVAPLEALMRMQRQTGQPEAALRTARKVVERMPGNLAANAVIVEDLKARDASAAIGHVRGLLSQARSERAKAALEAWLADLEEEASPAGEVVARWKRRAAAHAAEGIPLSPVSLPPDQVPAGAWPPLAEGGGEGAAELQIVFLWGPPGSCVENVANLLSVFPGFRGDRLSEKPPMDGLQRYASVEALSAGHLDARQVVEEWRQGLPARGIHDERVIEWLAWWDNALLRVLRPHFGKAAVLFVVRDPRDMLLEWLAHGAVGGAAMADPAVAAQWMAANLEQVVETVGTPLFRSVLLKLDGIEGDAVTLHQRLSGILGLPLPAAAAQRELSTQHLPAGQWRRYADALAGPFAALTPVALRLGYPEG